MNPPICPDCGKPIYIKKNYYVSDDENEYGVPYTIWKCSGCGIKFVELIQVEEDTNGNPNS